MCKCDKCGEINRKTNSFIYKERTYCMDCLYSLVMELHRDGLIHLDLTDCDNNGIVVQ